MDRLKNFIFFVIPRKRESRPIFEIVFWGMVIRNLCHLYCFIFVPRRGVVARGNRYFELIKNHYYWLSCRDFLMNLSLNNMNRKLLPFFTFALLILTPQFIYSDTFSIAAIDPANNQVGSAGASCYNTAPGCIILSDVHPGVGVIHTQASWLAANQNYARSLMNLGLTPQQIIDSLVAHDAQNNPLPRQYGIIYLNGQVGAYTGTGCTDWKGHLTGPTYSIQGNILLGERIIDSMKSRFLGTSGQLALRLMAALQGAKVIGADTRCTQTSSLSAFIRVANPNDPVNGPYFLDINVPLVHTGRDPIDSLQVLFNMWLTTGLSSFSNVMPKEYSLYQNYPNPFNPTTIIRFDITKQSNVKIVVYDMLGNEVAKLVDAANLPAGSYSADFDASNFSSGVYIYKMVAGDYSLTKKMTLVK